MFLFRNVTAKLIKLADRNICDNLAVSLLFLYFGALHSVLNALETSNGD